MWLRMIVFLGVNGEFKEMEVAETFTSKQKCEKKVKVAIKEAPKDIILGCIILKRTET